MYYNTQLGKMQSSKWKIPRFYRLFVRLIVPILVTDHGNAGYKSNNIIVFIHINGVRYH